MSKSDELTYNNPQFKPFQSGNSLCYPSKDYDTLKGGNKSLISTQPGKNMYKTQNLKVDTNLLKKTTMGISYATSAGGSKKSKKMKKGGEVPAEESQSIASVQSGGKSKKSKKMKKGGVTGMPSQFYNGKPIVGTSVNSGHINGVESLATQALASLTNNDNTGVQTGGKSKKSKKMKKGGDVNGNETSYTQSLSSITNNDNSSIQSGGKSKKSKKMKKGGDVDGNETPYTLSLASITNNDNSSVQSGGKSKKSKKMKKGGVTGMPSQFYNGKPIEGASANSGNGVQTSYGIIEPLDAGVGNLAPYNTSKNASKLSMAKTGGDKLIPRISNRPLKIVDGIVNKGARTIQTFFKEYKRAYNKSLIKIQNTKNGLNRLSQGGSKKKKILKGAGGSDFGSTLNSRGPSNAPDTGEKAFRVFNKTGEYIPNSQLAKAAAPILTGGPKVDSVKAFDPTESTFKSLNGGKSAKDKKSKAKAKTSTKAKAKTSTKSKAKTSTKSKSKSKTSTKSKAKASTKSKAKSTKK